MKKLSFVILACFLACTQRQQSSDSPLSFTDDIGREISFDQPPSRIISLAPNLTEILFAIDSGATLVGVTHYCTYPPDTKKKPSVGGMISPNLEIIAELNPDLILVTVEGNSKEDFDKLESLGYKLFVTNPRTIEDIYQSILTIGKIIQRDSSAARLVNSMRDREEMIQSVVKDEKSPRVFAVISIKPLMTVGPSTFLHQLIVKAGGMSVAENATLPYPIFNREEVLHQKPEYLVVTTDAVYSLRNLFSEFPEWESLPAVQQRRVLFVNADLVTRPGPRIIHGLELLARVFHTNKFLEHDKQQSLTQPSDRQE